MMTSGPRRAKGWTHRGGVLTRGTPAKDRHTTAIHEAGHAVVAHYLGAKVKWLRMDPKRPEWRAKTYVEYVARKVRGRFAPDPLVVAIVALSGHEAERLVHNRPRRLLPAGDYQHARSFGLSERSINAVGFVARRYVRSVLPEVRGVARQLLAAGKLDRRGFLRALRASA
jgi:hypothetical protein